MSLLQKLLTVLAITCVALCAQTTTSEPSRTKIGPSMATWITIEILGFIREPSKDMAQKQSTKSVHLGGISPASSKVDLSMTMQEKISKSSLPPSVTSMARSSLTGLNRNSQHLSTNAGHSGTPTEPSKTATAIRATKTTRSTPSAVTVSTSRERWLASVSGLFAVPPFYTSANSTDERGGITSTLRTTSFSQLPSFYTSSSNMTIFTGFGKPIYLSLPRYILLLASALPLMLLVIV